MKRTILLLALILALSTACAPQPNTPKVFTGTAKFSTIVDNTPDTIKVQCENCSASIITDTACTNYDQNKTVVVKDGEIQIDWNFAYTTGQGAYTVKTGSENGAGGGCSNIAELTIVMQKGGTITDLH